MMLVAGTFLASCSSLQTISFDQLQAGDVSFPDAVRKVAVINNMPVFKAKDNHEILSAELEGDGKVASEALAENIANVNYFDQVVICDSAFRATDEVPRANVVLTKEEIQKLSEDLGVDMILSFDRIHIQTKPGILLYPDYPVPVDFAVILGYSLIFNEKRTTERPVIKDSNSVYVDRPANMQITDSIVVYKDQTASL